MPWIQQIPINKATGFLKKQFDAAIERAGIVWNIVHITRIADTLGIEPEDSIPLWGKARRI